MIMNDFESEGGSYRSGCKYLKRQKTEEKCVSYIEYVNVDNEC